MSKFTHCFSTSRPAHSVGVTCMQQKKNEKKKKGEEDIPSEPIHRLHAAASPELVVSLWVEEGGQSHADHRPCAETVRVMHARWVQAVTVIVIVVETLRLCGSFGFWPGKGGGTQRWCLGACREGVQMHRNEKKKKKGLTNSNPHKNPDLHSVCRACV